MSHLSCRRLRRASPSGGFTLVEIIVALGLFAIVMMLSSGAYLIMIGADRQAQSIASGINNLSFALSDMTRSIRTGTDYSCSGTGTNGCPAGGSSLSFTDSSGTNITYSQSFSASECGGGNTQGCIIEQVNGGAPIPLTDPSVAVSSLTFYAYDVNPASQTAPDQARVTIAVGGTTQAGHGQTEPFAIETGATMRATNLP